MLEDMATLIAGMLLVFVASVLFVNAMEYLGGRFRLGSSLVSATLAPVFTSMPELVVFIVAIFAFGGSGGEKIGLGTIFGEPFMASSLSYGLTGMVILAGYRLKARNDRVLKVDRGLITPYIFITALFPATLLPALIGGSLVRYAFASIFLASYVIYVILMVKRTGGDIMEVVDEPYFHRLLKNGLGAGALQLAIAAALLYWASSLLVQAVNAVSVAVGISALGLSIILIPAATAIPETISALIWAWRGKDTLSIGSLVGEKVLYATVYPALGLLVTPWALDVYAYASVLTTFLVSLVLLYYILRGRLPWYALMIGMGFFLAYAVFIFSPILG
jgi:cation:H+ antiporter